MTPFHNLPSAEFEQALAAAPDAVLLDVRTPEEYAEGHIPQSVNLNFYDEAFMDKLQDLDPTKTYYVYCRSGKRSMEACLRMSSLGFEHLTNLHGGILAWKGAVE